MKKLFTIILLTVTLNFLQAQAYIQTPMPAQSGTNTPNVRGYFFTAQSCFTITGVEVPTDASSGSQSIAILRMPVTPPVFSTTTNVFDILYFTQNNATPGIIGGLNILVNQGDIIGVLGYRGTINSYGNLTGFTTIEGISTPIARMGMQFPLTTTPPQQIWSEPSSMNISRVWLYYDSTMLYTLNYSNIGADYTFSDGTDTMYTSLYTVWDYGDGSPLDTNYNPTHTYVSSGIFNVCAYINTTCGIDTVCTSVNVCLGSPTAAFSDNTAAGTLTTTFTDLSTNASGWYWDFGDGNTSTSQNPVHNYASVGWYTITLIASNPCSPNDTIIDSILVCTPPVVGFTYTVAPDSVDFTNLTVYGSTSSWDFGDGNTSTSTNPTYAYAANGTYNACLISTNICGADTICMAITACPNNPTPGFSYTNAVFDANFTNTTTFSTSVLWNFGDGNTSTTASPTHTYAVAGNYWVCLTAYDECGDSATFCDSVSIAGNVGMEEFNEQPALNTYPNPTTGQANIILNCPKKTEGKLYITDMTGKIVTMIYSGVFQQGSSQYSLHANTWPRGVYLLVWETDQWKSSKKIVVN